MEDILLIAIFAVIGAAFLEALARVRRARRNRAETWDRVNGHIIAVDFDRDSSESSGSRYRNNYRARYQYRVDGQLYRGRSDISFEATTYSVGDQLTVYVHPKHPQRSIEEGSLREIRFVDIALGIAGIIFLLLAIVGVFV